MFEYNVDINEGVDDDRNVSRRRIRLNFHKDNDISTKILRKSATYKNDRNEYEFHRFFFELRMMTCKLLL